VERIKAPARAGARQPVGAAAEKSLRLVHGDGHAGLGKRGAVPGDRRGRRQREAPRALLRQLALGGRMILPVHEGTDKRLMLYERARRGFVESERNPVRFVPMETGKAWNSLPVGLMLAAAAALAADAHPAQARAGVRRIRRQAAAPNRSPRRRRPVAREIASRLLQRERAATRSTGIAQDHGVDRAT
jgi:hypothetical protein